MVAAREKPQVDGSSMTPHAEEKNNDKVHLPLLLYLVRYTEIFKIQSKT